MFYLYVWTEKPLLGGLDKEPLPLRYNFLDATNEMMVADLGTLTHVKNFTFDKAITNLKDGYTQNFSSGSLISRVAKGEGVSHVYPPEFFI